MVRFISSGGLTPAQAVDAVADAIADGVLEVGDGGQALAVDLAAGVVPDLLPFAPTSPWRLGIATTAAFAAGGDARNVDIADVDGNGQAWVNRHEFSHPVNYASDSDPLATVTDSFHAPGDVPAGGSWQERIPATARIAPGTDGHMHVITPDRRYVQEHISVTRQSGTAYTTTRRHQVDLYGDGIGPQNGTRAYGGSAVGGLIRAWEVDPASPAYTGEIRHPLAVALRSDQLHYSGVTLPDDGHGGTFLGNGYGRAQGYVWPATEQDFDSPQNYSGAIPMGSYFAIPANVDIQGLGLSTPQARMVAKAAQDYGVYVTDGSGASSFYVEDDGGTATQAFVDALIGPSFTAADVKLIFKALRVVTNNAPATPNGGALDARRRGSSGLARTSDLRALAASIPAAAGSVITARMFLNYDLSVGSGGVNPVPLNSTEYNRGGGITLDATTGEFTVSQAGVYLVSAEIEWAGGASGARTGIIQVNGSGRREFGQIGVNPRINATVQLVLAANDKVRLATYHEGGGGVSLSGGTNPADVGLAVTRLGA